MRLNRCRSVVRLIAVAAVLVLLPHVAAAQCDSRYERDLPELNWASLTRQSYTICYDERYSDDAAMVADWLDATLQLGRQKYGVARPTYQGRDLYTTVFLPPVPTQDTNAERFGSHCCEGDGSVYHLEIHYLTPSAWPDGTWGPLDIPFEDSHPHQLTHLMSRNMHYSLNVHYSLESGSRPPFWIIEGLAEYDGYFYTTAYNRTTAIDSLIRHVYSERGQITCCNSRVVATSPYHSWPAIMMFLAERFGEGIHVELLTTPLEEVLKQRGATVEETFDELQVWLEQRARTLNSR